MENMPLVQVDHGKILEAEDLHKSYGSLEAVDGVSFAVEVGEVFGIRDPTALARPPQ